MYNGICNFTYNSTLKSKNLSRSKTRIKIYNSTELATKKNKKECVSQRLNDLARPNVRRIRSIFEKQKKKSKFDMIRAEKLLKLMNEPPKKPFDVKRCIEELDGKNRNKQERVTHTGDKEYEKCRQYRDFQCVTDKRVLLENQKLQYNNSFKPQKNLIDNYKNPFAPPRTNNNVTNFKVSTEKYITTEEFERRCRNNNLRPSILPKYNKNNQNFVSQKPINVNDNEPCQKSRNLQNVPRSLFSSQRNKNENQIIRGVPEKTTFKPKKESRNISMRTTATKNETVKSNENSTKMFSIKSLSFNKERSLNDKPQKIDLIPRQYTFDSGFGERIETQNLISASPKTSIASTSPKIISENESHSFIEDPVLVQAVQMPDFLAEDSTEHEEQQSILFDSNNNFPNSSSTPVDASSITELYPISQTTDNITMDHQLQLIGPDVSSISQTAESSTIDNQLQFNTPKSSQTQEYSYPDVYENFSISLLTENDSSILKLSNNSTSSDSPHSILARQSSFNKNAKISDFGTFIAQQGESSSTNASQLPVIALRDFSEYHDIGIDKDNEILVRVTSANFDKIYIVTKINDERNLDEFCKSPVSSRSKLFLLNSSNERKEIEIKKLETKSINRYCSKEHKESVEDYTKNSLLSSINHEKFSVQKLDKASKSPNSKGIDIHVTENSDKNSNFIVVKEQSTCDSCKSETEVK